MIDIPNASLEEWLADLKIYQREQVAILLQDHDPVEAATLWITASGASDTRRFGGIEGDKVFSERFVEEFKKFICGDQAYNEDRKQLVSEGHIAKTVLISVTSGAVGAHLGVMASLLVPAVAIMLHVAGKVGVNAWCAEFPTTPSQQR